MEKKYLSVKEVCKKTGLNRKLLFDYKDVVSPSGYTAHGYKEYSEEDLEKLQYIAIFRGLGLKREEIKKIMKDSNVDYLEICNKQKKMLIQKKNEIETQLELIELIKIQRFNKSCISIINNYIKLSKEITIDNEALEKSLETLFDKYDIFSDQIINQLIEDFNIYKYMLALFNAKFKNRETSFNLIFKRMTQYLLETYDVRSLIYLFVYYYSTIDENIDFLEGLKDLSINGKKIENIDILDLFQDINVFYSNMYFDLLEKVSPYFVNIIELYKFGVNNPQLISKVKDFDKYISDLGLRNKIDREILLEVLIVYVQHKKISQFVYDSFSKHCDYHFKGIDKEETNESE